MGINCPFPCLDFGRGQTFVFVSLLIFLFEASSSWKMAGGWNDDGNGTRIGMAPFFLYYYDPDRWPSISFRSTGGFDVYSTRCTGLVFLFLIFFCFMFFLLLLCNGTGGGGKG